MNKKKKLLILGGFFAALAAVTLFVIVDTIYTAAQAHAMRIESLRPCRGEFGHTRPDSFCATRDELVSLARQKTGGLEIPACAHQKRNFPDGCEAVTYSEDAD